MTTMDKDQTAPAADPYLAQLAPGPAALQVSLKWVGDQSHSKDWSTDNEGAVHYRLMPLSGQETEKVNWAVRLTVPTNRSIDNTSDPDDRSAVISSGPTATVVEITPATEGRRAIPANGLDLTVHWSKTKKQEPVVVPVTITHPVHNSALPQGPIIVTGTAGPNKQVAVRNAQNYQMCIATADAQGRWECQGILTTGHHTLSASTDNATSHPVMVTVGLPGPFYAALVQGHGSDRAYLEHVGGPSSTGPKDEILNNGNEGTVHYRIFPRSHVEMENVNWTVQLTLPSDRSLDTTKMNPDDVVATISTTPAGKIIQIMPNTQGRKSIPVNGEELTIYWHKNAA